jgi:transcription-repair coupling factor (superfamily II helicase)
MADRILMGGAPEGFDAKLLAREAARGQPVIHIARDDRRMEAMRAALSVLSPASVVLEFPAWDCLPYDRVSPNPDIGARRMSTLAALASGVPGNFVLLTTLNAATQRIPARAVLETASFAAKVGDRVDEARLKRFLANMGFSPVSTVAEPGDFALRGGIVDIFPPGRGGPVRLDFFGDQLDGIRRFDPVTQRTTQKLSAVEFAPMSEVLLDEAAIARFRQNYRVEFGAGGSDDPLYEAVSAGRKHQGMEHWLPFFHARLETLFDYMPNASVILDDQVTAARLSRWEGIADQYDSRHEAMTAKGRLDTVYKPSAPNLLYLNDAAWEQALAPHRVVQLSPLPQSPGPGVLDAQGRIGRTFAPERQQENVSLFGAFADHLRSCLKDSHVVIASYSDGARERLKGLLEDEKIKTLKEIKDFRDIPDGRGGLFLVIWPLEAGFRAPDLTVISEQDVLGERMVGKPRKKRKADNFLREVDTLTPGDLVVHVEHGVGRYLGLETITALGAPHACEALEYAENAKLYLPVENIELLSRYGHEAGLLERLGGGAWQAKKAKL